VAWHEAARLEALVEDEPLGVTLGGQPVFVCLSGGDVHALHDVCTHQHALLSEGYVEDGCIECPLHQGRFDLRTGEPFGGPVDKPVKVYAVKVDGGKVLVDVPE
jgi:3-phenylpropionate/trans-cinnamate dioxygenase ferredoxin subunit